MFGDDEGMPYDGPGSSFRRTHGWAARQTFFQGGQDTAGNPRTTQLQLAADFSGGGEERFAVEFMVQFQVTNTTGIPVRPQAKVAWMVEGVPVTRRFDVVDGMTITGVGQAVNVTVDDITDPNLDFTGFVLGQQYSVSATVVPGTRPAQEQPPTLWDSFRTLEPDGGFTIPIPLDAGVINVEVVAYASNPPIKLRAEFIAGANVFKTWDVAAFPRWIPVPPQATSLTIVNEDGSGEHTCDVTVTWGIDG